MSSAKAALESDTRVLAYEAGRKWGVRVNTISAGPLGSRAAKAIGFIDDMIRCRALARARPPHCSYSRLASAHAAGFSGSMMAGLVMSWLSARLAAARRFELHDAVTRLPAVMCVIM